MPSRKSGAARTTNLPAQVSTRPIRDFRPGLIILAVAAATLLAYHPAWHGGMLWDDDAHITRAALRSLQGLKYIWFDIGATQQYYPLLHSAFWLQHRLWGDATTGYHIVNILLHAGSALLIALLLRRLAIPGAVLAAFIFALHPVHVESVAWMTELKNTLSGFLYLSAALAYLTYDHRRNATPYWIALALFGLALLTKTVTATLPAALLVVFWWRRGRIGLREDVRPLLPFFAAAVIAGLGTAWVERSLVGAQGAEFDLSPIDRVLIAGRAAWFYAGKLAWPADLTFIYPRWQISASDPAQYVYVVGAAAALALFWMYRRRSRAPLAAALVFGGTLVPVLGFFDVFPFRYSFVADHFQYLASIAPIALFAAGVALLVARIGGGTFAYVAAIALIAGPLGLLTWQRSHDYRDSDTLFRATLARNPDCWMCLNNLAVMQLDMPGDQVQGALARVDESVRLNPRNPEGHNNRGVLLRRLGRVDDAIVAFRQAIRYSPQYADAYEGLASALLAAGDHAQSAEAYREMLRLKADAGQPVSASAYDSLGVALARLGHADEAIAAFEAALRADAAHAVARSNLATALAEAGRTEEAIGHYTEAIRLKPGDPKAHDNLGYLLLRMGRRDEASPHFDQALQHDPTYGPAHLNAGNLLLAADRPAAAVHHLEKAIAYTGSIDRAQAHNHLGVALAMLGQRERARAQFREALRLRPEYQDARTNLARVDGR